MKKNINKIFSIFLLISIVVSNLPLGTILAYVRPSIALSSPNKSTVNVGGTVSYRVSYSDADNINLTSSYVTLNGFTAKVSVSGSGDIRTVTLSNIQGTAGKKSISIKANSAENDNGNALATPNSVAFTLNGTSGNSSDKIRPSISVSYPDKSSVNVGGTVSYRVSYSDNVSVSKVNITSSYITLNGFTANISVSNSSNKSVVTLSNIQGTAGKKSISIKAGAASDSAGNSTAAINSTVSFNLAENSINQNSNNANVNPKNLDKVRPSVSISAPSETRVYNGGTLSYTVSFADNRGVERVNLSTAHIILNGFTANINITGKGLNRLVTLSNIQGTAGKKNISIKSGAASDSAGNISLATPNSISFDIVNKQVINSNKPSVIKPTTNKNLSNKIDLSIDKNTNIVKVTLSEAIKSTPKIVSGCKDNANLGDINKEIKTFSARLTSEKTIVTYAQENNYVAKDEEITYVIDYYNGKKDASKNVALQLNIPYNVDVLEINSQGKIQTQSASQTVIIWNKASVQKGEKCRLYVKVKFLQNTLLEKSNNISEQFYVTLNTKYDDKNENTYLRQLYIDKNTGKTATAQKYLSIIDNTNSIRPDDKITRAELAKILVDTGIIQLKKGNTDYKKYKDAEEIPTYARDAVSALYNTGIIEEFSDSEFKPNNPIVRDEFFKIVAKASDYISNGKMKINKSTFIYTDIIDDKDKTITDNKNYIMELIRQNVIKKQDVRPDEYTLRKEAVEVINALTFRGPYVEEVKDNMIKFADINENSSYFYDIVGASSTYTYTYSDALWQKIVNIK